MFSLRLFKNRLIGYHVKNPIKYSSSSTQLVITENRDKVTLIGINRPEKRNCVNRETAKQLLNAFEKFENDTNSVVAVLHGIGGTFCAGFDLKELSSAKGQNIDLNEFLIRGPMV